MRSYDLCRKKRFFNSSIWHGDIFSRIPDAIIKRITCLSRGKCHLLNTNISYLLASSERTDNPALSGKLIRSEAKRREVHILQWNKNSVISVSACFVRQSQLSFLRINFLLVFFKALGGNRLDRPTKRIYNTCSRFVVEANRRSLRQYINFFKRLC